MIQDPYQVLGVDEHVSDQELKKAYRDLSKRYHPDANPDNMEEAEAKFKEIQEAYRQIVTARERGTSAYGTSSGGTSYGSYQGYGGFDEFFQQWAGYRDASFEERTEHQAARNYINNGYYREAMNALNQVPELERTARWYYYAAYASQGMGSNLTAMEYAKRACDLEPNHREYQMLLRQLQNGGTWYTTQGEHYGGFNPVSNPAGWCLSMCALNLLCNCCI